MLEKVIRYIQGYLYVSVTGVSIERFLNLCRHKHLRLWSLRMQENCCKMYISVHDFRKLKPVIRKTKTKVVIEERFGLPFLMFRNRKRKCFLIGIILCILIVYMFSLFIWKIQIEGNTMHTNAVILQHLKENKIVIGMPKRKIDCQDIIQCIRKNFPEIVWVSAHVNGCSLIIDVKDFQNHAQLNPSKIPCCKDIISEQDGTIISMITRTGTPLVTIGTEVKRGDILVAGNVDVKNDEGEIIRTDVCQADADIVIQYRTPYEKKISISCVDKKYTGRKKYNLVMQLGNYKYKVGGKHISYKKWDDQVCKKWKWNIGYVEFRQIREYTPFKRDRGRKEIENKLWHSWKNDCEKWKASGLFVENQDLSIRYENDYGILSGMVIVRKKVK